MVWICLIRYVAQLNEQSFFIDKKEKFQLLRLFAPRATFSGGFFTPPHQRRPILQSKSLPSLSTWISYGVKVSHGTFLSLQGAMFDFFGTMIDL